MRREYFIRLATVAVWLLIILVLVQGVLLIPSYIFQNETVIARTTQLQKLSANVSTAQEQQVQTGLKALQAESSYLLNLQGTPTASTALRAVLAVPRQGISITGFTFGPPSTVTPATSALRTMQITGMAATRENLRTYDAALSALPFVSNADLPISDYAKDNDIPFTITLTGTLKP